VDFFDIGVKLLDEADMLRAHRRRLAIDARDRVGGEEEDGSVAEFADEVEDEFRRQANLGRDGAFGARVDDGALAMGGAITGLISLNRRPWGRAKPCLGKIQTGTSRAIRALVG
jgi:hypothetical protein